jgi:hypothetical protein
MIFIINNKYKAREKNRRYVGSLLDAGVCMGKKAVELFTYSTYSLIF